MAVLGLKLQELLKQQEQLQQDIQELKQQKWLDKVQIDMEILFELHMLHMRRDQELQKQKLQHKLQELLQQKEHLQQDIQELKQQKWLDKVQIDMEILLQLHMLQMTRDQELQKQELQQKLQELLQQKEHSNSTFKS